METRTLIVGAGFAGLAVAGLLRRAGAPFTILEASDRVGSSWRRHYRRLHLHTPKHHSSLPGLAMGPELPRYPSREQVVGYLESYTRELGIEPRFNETVTRIRRDGDEWVSSTDSSSYRSQNVVVGTGYNFACVTPEWPGMEAFAGTLVHSRDYVDGAPYRDQRVLVVGAGNTGAEIAICLHEHGARWIALSVRGYFDVIPRRFLGLAMTDWAIASSYLPLSVQDRITRNVSRLSFGRLDDFGLAPSGRPVSRIVEEGRIPTIDVGTVELIKEGRVRVVGAVERFTESGVVVPEGAIDVDAVILATGYRTGLASIIEPADDVLDRYGYPNRRGVESELPGLYFVGFSNPPTGLIRSIGIDAKKAVRSICAR